MIVFWIRKADCAAAVIIPAVRDNQKKFEYAKQRLELICPSCHRFFFVPFGNVEIREVTDEQLTSGFIDGELIKSRPA
jgi:hypothetical protein